MKRKLLFHYLLWILIGIFTIYIDLPSLEATHNLTSQSMTNVTLLKFSALWCGPCAQQEKILVGANLPIPIIAIDVDEQPELARKWRVRTLPTLILVEADLEKQRWVGTTDLARIKKQLECEDITP